MHRVFLIDDSEAGKIDNPVPGKLDSNPARIGEKIFFNQSLAEIQRLLGGGMIGLAELKRIFGKLAGVPSFSKKARSEPFSTTLSSRSTQSVSWSLVGISEKING